jgi:hypothetical protein
VPAAAETATFGRELQGTPACSQELWPDQSRAFRIRVPEAPRQVLCLVAWKSFNIPVLSVSDVLMAENGWKDGSSVLFPSYSRWFHVPACLRPEGSIVAVLPWVLSGSSHRTVSGNVDGPFPLLEVSKLHLVVQPSLLRHALKWRILHVKIRGISNGSLALNAQQIL